MRPLPSYPPRPRRRRFVLAPPGRHCRPFRHKQTLSGPAAQAGSRPSASATTVVAGRTVRRLSPSEVEERRRLDLCFNCNERYVRGHNHSCKKLFFLDAIEDDKDTGA